MGESAKGLAALAAVVIAVVVGGVSATMQERSEARAEKERAVWRVRAMEKHGQMLDELR